MKRLCIVVAVWCTTTPALPAGQEVSATTALDQAEARWQIRKPKGYEYAIEVRCMLCSAKVPPRFRVLDGLSRPLDQLDHLDPLVKRAYESFSTVEKLFAAIRGRLSRGQYKVVVEYDAQYSYPVVADLDPRRDVFDDELYFRVTNFRPVQLENGQPNSSLQPTSISAR